MANVPYLIVLIISNIFSISLIAILLLNKQKRNQIKSIFMICLICMFIWSLSLILQILFQNYDIDPVLFEGFASFGACFIPVAFMFLGILFSKTKIHFNWKYSIFLLIPIISTILMFSNSQHHLFFKEYSPDMSKIVTGPYHLINAIYSYSCILIGLIYLLKYSIKNSGFFSKQSLLIILGTVIPVLINICGTFKIIDMVVYVTPISFTIALGFYALAIFKFGFLKVAPIALQRIVDRISDSYLVLNDELIVTDFNQTFLETFRVTSSDIRNNNIVDLLAKYKEFNIDVEMLIAAIKKTRLDDSTITVEEHFEPIDKYFHIEINSIKNKGNFLGTLILLKDITQHIIDIQTIKDNQDRLIEKERLASLGQMIGGIAHNLKTPIMSIAGAAEGLSDLTNEYRTSIGDPEVTVEDHHEIANDMDTWIEKIRTHLSYMSDIITAVKGQAVNFSDNTFTGFTVGELVKYVDILMKHELKNALINFKTTVNLDENTKIGGNINSLVQVINNIISNAIQAYNGKPNQEIDFILSKSNDSLIIKVQDFAGGLPKNVQEKLFKEMITTKGKNGTGLGLFMSYSNIKAHFNGDMKYETKQGEGTTFILEIPLNKVVKQA